MTNQILILSSNEKLQLSLGYLLKPFRYDLRAVATLKDLREFESNDFKPDLCIVEAGTAHKETLKKIDACRGSFPLSKYLVLYSLNSKINISELFQSGVFQVLQRPFEDNLILNAVFEASPIPISDDKVTLDCLAPVHIVDLSPEKTFDFDIFIYLPTNQKLFLYRRKNSALSEHQIEKFKKSNFKNLYIRKSESGTFRRYVADQMKATLSNSRISETEKTERLQNEVRSIMLPLFDGRSFNDDQSRMVLENCKNIVAEFILDSSPRPEVYKQILALSSQVHNNYHHAVNVSAYATLFGIGLGFKDIESLTVGALLHDIGIAYLSSEVAGVPSEKLSEEQKEEYRLHVTKALEVLKKKKIPISESIKAIVLQHHEAFDGSGYPSKLKKDQISPFARLVAIADEFDELTSIRPGTATHSPQAALRLMQKQNAAGSRKFDPDLLEKIISFLHLPDEHDSLQNILRYDRLIVKQDKTPIRPKKTKLAA